MPQAIEMLEALCDDDAETVERRAGLGAAYKRLYMLCVARVRRDNRARGGEEERRAGVGRRTRRAMERRSMRFRCTGARERAERPEGSGRGDECRRAASRGCGEVTACLVCGRRYPERKDLLACAAHSYHRAAALNALTNDRGTGSYTELNALTMEMLAGASRGHSHLVRDTRRLRRRINRQLDRGASDVWLWVQRADVDHLLWSVRLFFTLRGRRAEGPARARRPRLFCLVIDGLAIGSPLTRVVASRHRIGLHCSRATSACWLPVAAAQAVAG